jgi:hypothetical protein
MISRVLSTLGILFMAFDGIAHLLMPTPVALAFATLGFPMSTAIAIGVVELVLVVLYAVPRTSIVGAILLTGFLGGAVAAKVRIAAAPFDTVFPILMAAIIWGGLYLRDARVRSIWMARP